MPGTIKTYGNKVPPTQYTPASGRVTHHPFTDKSAYIWGSRRIRLHCTRPQRRLWRVMPAFASTVTPQ